MIKPMTTILFATILLIAAILATAASVPEVQPPVPRPPLYVVEYDTGPSYLPGRPFAEQPGMTAHAEYMDELESRHVLLFGGPVFDDLDTFTISGALLFLSAGSVGEARLIAEADPAIANGLMVIVGVKPFMAMIAPF